MQIATTVFSTIEAWVVLAVEGKIYDVMVKETNVVSEQEHKVGVMQSHLKRR